MNGHILFDHFLLDIIGSVARIHESKPSGPRTKRSMDPLSEVKNGIIEISVVLKSLLNTDQMFWTTRTYNF